MGSEMCIRDRTDIQTSMDANGLTEERYLSYWQEKLLIDTMAVDTADDIANKMAAVETLQTSDWLEALSDTKLKLIGVIDFSKGYRFCPQKDDDDLEGWDKVEYAAMSMHMFVLRMKLTSHGIFKQAIYPIERQVDDKQREIETGVKNAATCEDNWNKSSDKAAELNLVNVSKHIAKQYHAKLLLPTETIFMFTPPHTSLYNKYAEERTNVVGEANVGLVKDITKIAYCSGASAYIKGIAMEWVLVSIIDKVLMMADSMGYSCLLYTSDAADE